MNPLNIKQNYVNKFFKRKKNIPGLNRDWDKKTGWKQGRVRDDQL